MMSASLYAVIIGLLGATACAAVERAPEARPARAVIPKVLHELRPKQSPPPLMRDVLNGAEVDWAAVVRRDPDQEPGEYFWVAWKISGRPAHPKIRLEYRQARDTEPKVRTTENFKFINGQTRFVIKGDEFQRGGPVTAWRATVLDGENILATKQSFMW